MSNVIPMRRKRAGVSGGKKGLPGKGSMVLDEQAALLAAASSGLRAKDVTDRLDHIEICIRHAIKGLQGALSSIGELRK